MIDLISVYEGLPFFTVGFFSPFLALTTYKLELHSKQKEKKLSKYQPLKSYVSL